MLFSFQVVLYESFFTFFCVGRDVGAGMPASSGIAEIAIAAKGRSYDTRLSLFIVPLAEMVLVIKL
jgi:hypothetical protein